MSTYWHIRCTQCDEENEGGLNHGDKVMQAVLDLLPQIEAIYKGDPTGYVEVKVLGAYDAISFVQEHHGHPLIVRNEYGMTIAEDDAQHEKWRLERELKQVSGKSGESSQ